MDGHVKVSSTWKKLEGIHVKVSGTWKEVQNAYIKVSGVWKQFYVSFSASADDSTPSGSDSGGGACGAVSTNSITITAVGGAAPYTYAWVQTGDPATQGPFSISSAVSNNVNWESNPFVCDGDADEDEQWTCTVTDDNDLEVEVVVTVTLSWTQT